MASQRHIIAITMQNESGALTRVAGLFSTRGYNIESLNVAPTSRGRNTSSANCCWSR
jgi:acetolactate synthase small subunit